MKALYLLIDFFTILVPFIFSFHPKIQFNKALRYFLPANLLAASIFIVWDIIFTKIGVWGFNPDYLMGSYIASIPMEELLFFICIPYACVFTVFSFNIFFKLTWNTRTENIFVMGASAILLVVGILNYNRWYTSTTFISLALFLLFLKYWAKVAWLSKLVLVYPVLLIPFFVVNGILTGTGLPAPVVWYNDNENLGIRLLTIPVEDIFYGFELILLNFFFYEQFKGKLIAEPNE
ncbi:MAG: lycopene cyclase domain-containing protein [Saprospiraceae bacterium]|nr:lycopene cyclase domain-containing protein [Saprospiraceae bacterium]